MAVTIITGDCREVLGTLPPESVHCCVTSPPYYGLRDYGVSGQIGLERSPQEYVDELVGVFREVRRVLRSDGTVWLNLGDSYAATGKSGGGKQGKRWEACGADACGPRGGKWSPAPDGLKPKDLIGIPWRVAFALQQDGWWLRQDIIWHKPNPMPESVRDRCTKAHEYVFLLAKSESYYFDAQAISEPAAYAGQSRGGSTHRYEQNAAGMDCKVYDRRNKRSVWSIKPAVFKGAHFATFPEDLISPCILAGSPAGGTVLDPFGGSGTTGFVSEKLGRNSVLIELNPEYVVLAQERTAQRSLLTGE